MALNALVRLPVLLLYLGLGPGRKERTKQLKFVNNWQHTRKIFAGEAKKMKKGKNEERMVCVFSVFYKNTFKPLRVWEPCPKEATVHHPKPY